jgi:DNA-binding transcriptional ArsR family regulator
VAIVLRLSGDDWANSRFVTSPLWEAFNAVRALAVDPHEHARRYHRGWLARVDRRQALTRCRHLVAVNPHRGWVPDFLTPPPAHPRISFDDELARVAATPPGLVVADLRRSLAADPAPQRRAALEPLLANPAHAAELLCDELRLAWRLLVEPHWQAVHRLLDNDISWRSGQAAQHGLATVIDDLHAHVRRRPGRIVVDDPDDLSISIAGRGLLLMPSAFAWPHIVVITGQPWHPTLIYPARGVGELWQQPPPPPQALGQLLGPTRAKLLTDLRTASTTTALACRHGLSAATVSAHLTRLRDAGLLIARRDGHQVRYRRTQLGTALVASAGHRDHP